ncbi:SDR family oxidoreductase [Methylophilaceae bacterium]|jgi:UDP-glucose 4-epimerase|nr:SDR family oxidoreductase [Methylophilaceae bacterium]
MKALVTGGCGFIGSHLVETLLADGHEVTIFDNLISGRLENIKSFKDNPKLQFCNVDIRNLSEIEKNFKSFDWVFHLAALADIVPSIEQPENYFNTNVTGTFNILEAARKNNIKRFIYVASSSSYGIAKEYPTSELSVIKPMYPYALTKNIGEELVLNWDKIYGMKSISLRLFNVYGPRSRTTGAYGAVFGVFLAQKINNKPYTVVGDGTQTRDFTYVSDVCEALILSAKSGESGTFNVGSGNHYSVNKLVELLGGPVVNIPKRPAEPDCTFADISKIKTKLNWSPKVSLEDGVKQLLIHLDLWKDAPVWDEASIELATKSWFKYFKK